MAALLRRRVPAVKGLVLVVLCTALLAACAPRPAAAPFAVYLGNAPQGEPVIATADIVSYDRATHAMELTPEAAARIAKMHVPTSGLPFVVCVGAEPIYRGAFWTPFSSQSNDGLVIETLFAERGSVRIQLGYPESPELFQGQDLRADPRILRALEQAGKLR